MKELYVKIRLIKSKIGKISKDNKNPFYQSKYFDINKLLEHVEPLLEEQNLLLIQPIENNYVKSVIIDIESDQQISSSIQLPDLNDPQKIGSAITYYRRYSLKSLLGIQEEDDDANKASIKEDKEEKPWMNKNDDHWNKALEKNADLALIEKHYRMSKANKEEYIKQLTERLK